MNRGCAVSGGPDSGVGEQTWSVSPGEVEVPLAEAPLQQRQHSGHEGEAWSIWNPIRACETGRCTGSRGV